MTSGESDSEWQTSRVVGMHQTFYNASAFNFMKRLEDGWSTSAAYPGSGMFSLTCSEDESCGFCSKRLPSGEGVLCNGEASPHPERTCSYCTHDSYECCLSCHRGTGFDTSTEFCESCPAGFVNPANDTLMCSECWQGKVSHDASEPR